MTREELEHAIRAACDVAGDDAVYVFGSQAILGQYPEAPAALRQSVEVDVAPKSRLDRIDAIEGALGELSRFHETFHFYVHGLPLTAAKLPAGWERRAVVVRNEGTRGMSGLCLEVHDLAASKLVAFRDKDRDFVRVLLVERLARAQTLVARIRTLDISADERRRLVQWVETTAEHLERPHRGRR